MELWQNVEDKAWDKVLPGWHKDVIKIWSDEIKEKFTMMKRAGSYGPIDDTFLQTLLQNTEHQYLPHDKQYDPRYIPGGGNVGPKVYKSPYIYTKEGELKSAVYNSATYTSKTANDSISVSINVPANSVTPDAYEKLENSRSIFMSSFVLSWPKLITRTLERIGKK